MLSWSIRFGLLMACLFAGAAYLADSRLLMPTASRPTPTATVAATPARGADFGSEMRIKASTNGHFYVDTLVNSAPVRFMIDTGATSIMLSAQDAARIGLSPADRDYTTVAHTANGTIKLAAVPLREVRLGNFAAYDVDALVSKVPANTSLLGMSFLNQLQGWEVRAGELSLRW